ALLAVWLQPRYGIAGMLISELLGHLSALVFLAGFLSKRFVHADTAVPALKAAGMLSITLIALGGSFVAHERAWGPLLYTPILVALSSSVPWALLTRDERTTLAHMLIARWKRLAG
ncbi:MAG TPA: hypothetical protein VMF89_32775, partial [Polyangiales bacterium]|nr:hypothetical protein [Polyangiales bacterium]